MSIDPRYQAALATLAEAGCVPAEPINMALPEARAQQERYFEFLNREPPAVADVQELSIEGPVGMVPVRIYRPALVPAAPVLIFVRGVGWWAGSLDSHDRVMRLGACSSGCAILGIDYRRSPEHRYPTQLEEVLATVRWLRREGHRVGLDPSRVALWGESAGATLCLLAAMRMRDAGEELPKALLLFYGNFEGPKPTLRAQSRWFWQQYLGGDLEHPDPTAIPARQSVTGLPPTWLGVGSMDPLLKDSLAMYDRMRDAGVPCVLQEYQGLPHAFMNLTRLYPGSVAALEDATRFSNDALGIESGPTMIKELR